MRHTRTGAGCGRAEGTWPSQRAAHARAVAGFVTIVRKFSKRSRACDRKLAENATIDRGAAAVPEP